VPRTKKETKLQKALKRSAAAQGFAPGSDRYNRYVYGGMNAIMKRKRKTGSGGTAGQSWKQAT